MAVNATVFRDLCLGSESVFVFQLCICLFSHYWQIKTNVYDNQKSYNHTIFLIVYLINNPK